MTNTIRKTLCMNTTRYFRVNVKIFIYEILCADCFLCRSAKILWYNIPRVVFQVGFWFLAELVFCAGAGLLDPRGSIKVMLKWSLWTVCRHSNMRACSIHAVGWVPDRRRGWERREYSITMYGWLSKSAIYGGLTLQVRRRWRTCLIGVNDDGDKKMTVASRWIVTKNRDLKNWSFFLKQRNKVPEKIIVIFCLSAKETKQIST